MERPTPSRSARRPRCSIRAQGCRPSALPGLAGSAGSRIGATPSSSTTSRARPPSRCRAHGGRHTSGRCKPGTSLPAARTSSLVRMRRQCAPGACRRACSSGLRPFRRPGPIHPIPGTTLAYVQSWRAVWERVRGYHVFDAATATIVASVSVSGVASAPLVSGNLLYVSTFNGIAAIDLTTHSVVAFAPVPSGSSYVQLLAVGPGSAGPALWGAGSQRGRRGVRSSKSPPPRSPFRTWFRCRLRSSPRRFPPAAPSGCSRSGTPSTRSTP